ITYNITDACNISGSNGCDTSIVNPENAQGTATVMKRGSQASTTILSAGGQPVTTVEVGSIVHDSGSVVENSSPPPIVPGPVPTGSVSIDFFNNGGCTGSPVASGSAGLDASGNFNATGFPQGPLAAGHYSFQATYTGDGTYNASPAATCEPLTVVDANIQITPANATNPLNTNHTLTGHVNVNDGNGFANAPDGTLISFAILSGPGSFVGGVCTCTTSGGTGSCTVQITSGTAGTTVIRDSTTVSVGGISLSRSSGDGHAGDSADAQKVWINPDANIQITPATAVNAVGTNHTLTG